MRKTVLTVLPLVLVLGACGNDSTAPAPSESAAAPAAETAAPPPAAVTAAPSAPQVAAEETAAPVTDEVVYDPIDVSKLQGSWWQQYNKGG